MYKVISSVIEHTRRHPVSRHILRDVHANGHFNSPSSRHDSAESSETAKTAKNAEKWRYWNMRFFSPQSRPIFRPSERILSFLHHLLHPVPSPLGCLFGTGTGRWVLHFALALLLQVPGPLRTRARAREQERKRKREREHGAVCYNARPLLALLPVLLLLSLLLPVAAEWRMGKQRADEPAATSSAALEANYTPPARLASS